MVLENVSNFHGTNQELRYIYFFLSCKKNVEIRTNSKHIGQSKEITGIEKCRQEK